MTSEGDVVWSTTQESRGGKYKGAEADAAEKVAKELLRQLDTPPTKRRNSDASPKY